MKCWMRKGVRGEEKSNRVKLDGEKENEYVHGWRDEQREGGT